MKPLLAITIGDCNGVGPEVVVKALRSPLVRSSMIPLLIGPEEAFSFYARRLHVPFRPVSVARGMPRQDLHRLWADGYAPVCEPPGLPSYRPAPGLLSSRAARIAAAAIVDAVAMVEAGRADGIVTAPVSKKALHKAGVHDPGQTEMLQRLTRAPRVAMMLVSPVMRVGLVTIHIPLKDVARTITVRLLKEKILIIREAVRRDWRIRTPRIAVLGLNPHVGENGDIGHEEGTIIGPALRALKKTVPRLEGPFPADGFFGQYQPHAFDAIVAMYHDQGLIPLKMTAGGRGVNVSVGLPIVRTSPDHGTGFDIAGTGQADERSMIEALHMARHIIRNRNSGKLPRP